MSGKHRAYRILVADDEPALRDAYARVLSDLNAPPAKDGSVQELESELFGSRTAIDTDAPNYVGEICSGGQAAVDAIKSPAEGIPPTPVVFLDVRMPPGMDGIEAAARIRAMDPDINIVIVTAYADSHPREIAQRVPPLDKLFYISKPFQKTELQRLIIALTARWQAERDLRVAHYNLAARCTELETANSSLSDATQKAQFANKAKSEFLANMSHELRTPLNAIIGFSDLIRNEIHGALGNQRYQEYLEHIADSGGHLLRMINDLLDFAKIEAGKLDVAMDEVDPSEAIDGVFSMMKWQADKVGVTLRKTPLLRSVRLLADDHRLRQIILNLVSNAVKFTPDGGNVEVAVIAETAGNLTIKVTDTGIGMSEEGIERALEPFGQVSLRHGGKAEGTGLGLPIALRLTGILGGKLTIASKLGHGTTVSLSFPPSSVITRPAGRQVIGH